MGPAAPKAIRVGHVAGMPYDQLEIPRGGQGARLGASRCDAPGNYL
jgi:hypothetical protein